MNKFLIIGLGNIGAEYVLTRHNIGFMVLDRIAAKKELVFEPNRYASKTMFKHKGREFHLIKPSTYMNLSGKAVRFWMNELKIPISNILVITDEVALPFSKQRLKPSGSNGGHNGLGNIQELLDTKVYPRLRFGIGNEYPKGGQIDYVLGEFSDEQMENMISHLDRAGDIILSFGMQGIQRTMNEYNG